MDDPAKFKLRGNVTITLNVSKSTNVITIHTRSMWIYRFTVTIVDKGNDRQKTVRKTFKKYGYFMITMKEYAKVGDIIRVYIKYSAPLKQDGVGIYYSRYYEDGVLK